MLPDYNSPFELACSSNASSVGMVMSCFRNASLLHTRVAVESFTMSFDHITHILAARQEQHHHHIFVACS